MLGGLGSEVVTNIKMSVTGDSEIFMWEEMSKNKLMALDLFPFSLSLK